MKIKHKLQLNIFGNTFLFLSLSIVSYFGIDIVHRNIDHLSNDPIPSIIALHKTTSIFLSATEDVYAYNAFNAEREKEMYFTNTKEFDDSMIRLEQLVDTYPLKQKEASSKLIDEILAQWADFKKNAEESLSALTPETRTAALSNMDESGDKISDLLEELIVIEQKEIDETLQNNDTTVRQITSIIFFTGGIVLIISLFIGIRMLISITKPLSLFEEVAKTLGNGDFTKRITIANTDELGALAGTVNEMADHIQQSHTALNSKIKERTAELEEKLSDLEKMNKAMIGRELKMVELKREIEKLKNQAG